MRKQIAKIQKAEKRYLRMVLDDREQVELVEAQLRQLGRDRRGLADQLSNLEDKMARTTDRPRDVEALIAQACQGIDDLDEKGRFGLLRNVIDEIKVEQDRTLNIVGELAEHRAGETIRRG